MEKRKRLKGQFEDMSTFCIRKLVKEIRAYEDQWNLFDEKEKPQDKANTGKGAPFAGKEGEEAKRGPNNEAQDRAFIKELKRKVKNI